ncbi:MAG: ABC transporter permease [Pseudomonadota bacterium]
MKTRLTDSMVPVFIFLSLVIVFFLGFPVLKILLSVTPAALFKTLILQEVTRSFLLTFYCGLVATLLGLIVGVPLAYVLARSEFPGKRVIEGIIDMPVILPHSAAGIALLFVFGRHFMVGKAFGAIGIDFVGEVPGIVIAMLFVSVPFLVNAAKEGFKKVDVKYEQAARSLGASPWTAFFTIALPLAGSGILSGAIMMWARGLSEFGAVLIITYHPMIAPILVYNYFENFGLEHTVPVVALLILLTLVFFTLLRWLNYRWEKR